MTLSNKHNPPKWADNFLSWYCASEFIEEIQGDLHEAFHRRYKEGGQFWARCLFVLDVFRSLSLRTLGFRGAFHFSNSAPLFRNYFINTYRNLIKDKFSSLINIGGLAIGMAACFLIVQYVHFERSYDQFHKSKDSIFRVIVEGSRDGYVASNHPAAGPALKTEFPEIEDYARAIHQSIILGAFSTWSYTDGHGQLKVFNEESMYDVDPSFVTIFSFPFVQGDPRTALSDLKSVVISESIARKFFGSENPMGKTLVVDGFQSFNVTGVFKDIPENSHIKFNILISYYMQSDWFDNNNWRWPEFYTYIKLKPKTHLPDLERKLGGFAYKHLGDQMKEDNTQYNFRLQPLTDIHLKSPAMKKEREAHGNESMVYFLLIIASLILVIAWINYINMITAKSVVRAQEVGLRKIVGASSRQLFTQFLLESVLVNLLSVSLSFFLVILTLPYFAQLTGKNMGNRIQDLLLIQEPSFWLALCCVFLLGSIVVGIYPAFVLTSFKVVNAIKGKFYSSSSGITFRKILVGFQFTISLALIAGTLIVFNQVSFMRNQDPGYVKDQLLVIKAPLVVDSTFEQDVISFKTELLRNPAVTHVTSTSEIPGIQIPHGNSLRNFNEGKEDNFNCSQMEIDRHFLDTYGIKLEEGRNYREGEKFSRGAKVNPVLLNHRAIEKLGFKSASEALHQIVFFGWGEPDHQGEIVGVVANHHQRSMHENYDPIIFLYNNEGIGQYITVRLNLENASETIAFIEDKYDLSFRGNPFDYFFLDDYFDRQYAADQRFGKVFGLFSSLALVVASLGLLGLITFMISQRAKEIAIRRILGATLSGMIHLFSKDFLKLVLLANFIAMPVVYIMASNWLDSFAFHVPVGWMVILVPTIILLLISLATVSAQTLRTGSINPIKSLRSE